jgi:hypothetical protein
MKNILAICLTLTIGGTAFGLDHHLEPVPDADAVELFKCVKYKDLDEIAPCAVPKIIQVKDPCACENSCDCCKCCEPKCVSIKICVPPCECVEVKVSKNGTKVEYDYGEYSVDIRVKDGYIEVDYQD